MLRGIASAVECETPLFAFQAVLEAVLGGAEAVEMRAEHWDANADIDGLMGAAREALEALPEREARPMPQALRKLKRVIPAGARAPSGSPASLGRRAVS